MATKPEAKDVKPPTTPEVKDPPVTLSPETLAGCVETGGKAATPTEAARLTAACVLEHLTKTKIEQAPPIKEAEAPRK